jgi:uncharacterized membrane protein
MDRMLVVVFENESKAYEGQTALLELDREGSISVYGYAILAKSADGKTTVKQGDEVGPLGALTGTALGSLTRWSCRDGAGSGLGTWGRSRSGSAQCQN